MKLDILAIGAHPDDIELSCGGTLLSQAALGYKIGILDLTLGELGTRGNAEIRLEESAEAAKLLGVSLRENARFEDGFFLNDRHHQTELIRYFRRFRPGIVLANAVSDRHPDHGRAAKLVDDAAFLSGLSKIETHWEGKPQQAFRPQVVYHYVQTYDVKIDFAVDISNYFERKIEAIKAYKTQFFDPESDEPNTFISSPEFLDLIRARASHYGVPLGVKYAEGFTTVRTPGVADLKKIF